MRVLVTLRDFQIVLPHWVLATCLLIGVLVCVQFPKLAVLLLLLLLLVLGLVVPLFRVFALR